MLRKGLMNIKTHRFRGQRFDILIGELDGLCERPGPGDPNLVIALEPDDSLKFLETAIHEALHAVCYAKSEELVTEAARDIARFLRRLGYRREAEMSSRHKG